MSSAGLFGRAALAAVFVIPAVALQGRAPDSLAEALERTLAALDGLAQLELRVAAGEPGAVAAVIAATEAPLPPALRDDAALLALRGDVARLEVALDEVHAGASSHVPGHVGLLEPEEFAHATPPIATTGLDEATRCMLGDLSSGAGALPASTLPVSPTALPAPAAQAFEPAGYTADTLRLARAHYKRGRWREALELVERGDAATAEEHYWRARCLEKLGRDAEAARAYEQVIADPSAGEEAARAAADLEFLRWRLEFEARRQSAGGKGGA
jgi:tetratricopeptide (TPR) repeat protein